MPAFLLFLAMASGVASSFLATDEKRHGRPESIPNIDTTFHIITTGWAYQTNGDIQAGRFIFADMYREYVYELTRRIRDLGFERISVTNYDAYFEQEEEANDWRGPQSQEQAAKVTESVERIWRSACTGAGFDLDSSVIQFKGNWEQCDDEAVRDQVGGDGHDRIMLRCLVELGLHVESTMPGWVRIQPGIVDSTVGWHRGWHRWTAKVQFVERGLF